MNVGTDEKRLVIEIISNLVKYKNSMADLILKPTGVPVEICQTLLKKKDENTGAVITKRVIAVEVLESIANRGDSTDIILAIIKIAANWSNFHLAHDEFAARGTVQKARGVIGTLETMVAREKRQISLARTKELAKLEQERDTMLKKQSELLLMMFDSLETSNNPQGRGYLLQELLNQLFVLHGITVVGSFTRNDGGEQIDGAFKLEGWHYLVECRWRKKLADGRELDGLNGQVVRSGKQVMGLFLSINGWSDNVPELLKQNPDKSTILMEGYDLRCVLTRQVDLKEFLLAKIQHLSLNCEPYLGAIPYMATLSA
jgi:hypothetical protein